MNSYRKDLAPNLVNIAIHGVPRSGTSWVGEIFNSSPNVIYKYQPLFSYAHKDFLNHKSSIDDINLFFKRIKNCDDTFTNQIEKRENGEFPKFNKTNITHIAYKEVRYINLINHLMNTSKQLLLCAVIRNPLSVINSWLRAEKEFRKDLGWRPNEEWEFADKKNLNRPEEYNGFEQWKNATNIFLELKNKYPERVYLLRYEQLLTDRISETGKLFQFFNLSTSQQTIDFLKTSSQMRKYNSYSVYRKHQSDNKWKKQLPHTIGNKIIKDLTGTHLEDFINYDINY